MRGGLEEYGTKGGAGVKEVGNGGQDGVQVETEKRAEGEGRDSSGGEEHEASKAISFFKMC